MWNVFFNPVSRGDGSFTQNVTWSGPNGAAAPGNFVYSITIDGDAKREIETYLATDHPEGVRTNFTGVITIFLKMKSAQGESPSSVDGQILTAKVAREILGLGPAG